MSPGHIGNSLGVSNPCGSSSAWLERVTQVMNNPVSSLSPLFCPEILSSKTCDSPSWATKNHSKSAFLALRRWAFKHALQCFTKDEALDQKALSKHSTQGRHCCMDSRAASLETSHGMASNMASALGTHNYCLEVLIPQLMQGQKTKADSAKWLAACQLHISIWTVFFLYLYYALLPLAWGLILSWWHIEHITVLKSQ